MVPSSDLYGYKMSSMKEGKKKEKHVSEIRFLVYVDAMRLLRSRRNQHVRDALNISELNMMIELLNL
jgi:hypothetical protein